MPSEYETKGISANVIVSGATKTPMGDEMATDPEIVAFIENMHA